MKLFRTFQILVLWTIWNISANAQCQNYPFPQNTTYDHGIMPSIRSHVHAQDSYIAWKNTYVTTNGACGYRRVLFNDMNSTYSEGIGYGMLLAVNHNDQALFNDLWAYYNSYLDENGLMHWWTGNSCGAILGVSGATDADQDVAFALLLAAKQWCSQGSIDYRRAAIIQINRIYQHEVELSTFVLKPGDHWGGSQVTNPSYFAPAYYRAFLVATGNVGWRSVISKCYEILGNCANPNTGLVPDWCQANGLPAQGFAYYYYYDATRTPWRIALDYIWYGNEQARAFCERITNFARRIGSVNIREGYYLNGSPIGSQHNNVFVGPFGAGSMATGYNYQAFCDSAYSDNVSTVINNYYNFSLRTLTLFLQTGNFLSALEMPVPIQLAYFRGSLNRSRSRVELEWGTLTEVNNYGFEIQKRQGAVGGFTTVPNSFVPGHGTTTVPQHYSFTEATAAIGTWYYRIKQIDLDGRVHYTDAVQVDVVTDEKEKLTPPEFLLAQNYPNPWNPSTTIRYGLPHNSFVLLTIYNTLGQQVARLVNEYQEAGYHDVVFHGDGLASGVYFYRLQAGDFVSLKNLVLLR